jgi:hypothetical protein
MVLIPANEFAELDKPVHRKTSAPSIGRLNEVLRTIFGGRNYGGLAARLEESSNRGVLVSAEIVNWVATRK